IAALLDLLEQLEPRAVGQVVVGKDQVESLQVLAEGGAASIHADHRARAEMVLQRLAHDGTLARVIFDDEQLQWFHFPTFSSHPRATPVVPPEPIGRPVASRTLAPTQTYDSTPD